MVELSSQLAQALPKLDVNAAYGDPVEIDGTTLIPVACTAHFFGAGEGKHGNDTENEGEGSFSGGFATPVGAYVSRDGVTRFEPNLIALLVVGIPFVCVVGRALTRVIRALKR